MMLLLKKMFFSVTNMCAFLLHTSNDNKKIDTREEEKVFFSLRAIRRHGLIGHLDYVLDWIVQDAGAKFHDRDAYTSWAAG